MFMGLIAHYQGVDKNIVIIDKITDAVKTIRLPDYILFGIQDAGISPKRYNPSITNLITPGSYIDPGPRTVNEGYFYGFDSVIDMKSFRDIGMPMILKLESHLDTDKTYTIILTFDHMDMVNATFSKNLKSLTGDIEYFEGNAKKNKYFNEAGSINYEKACKFIICKELGDTLQALFGKKLASETENGYKKVCLFTNDNVLTLRCNLLNIQVVYNVNSGKSKKTFYHYPKMVEASEAFQKMWKDSVLGQNNNVKAGVQAIIEKGSYLMSNGGVVRFKESSQTRNILNKYITLCDKMNDDFLKITPNSMELEQYRKLSYVYKLPRLFIMNVLNSVVLNNRALFDAKEQMIMMNSIKVGGGTEDTELPPFIFDDPEEDDYTIDREYDDTFEETVQIKHALYKIFTENHPEKSKDELCYIIDGITSMLYVYFGFVGSSSSHPEFAMNVFQKYDKGTFGSQSLLEFEREYNCWANNEHSVVRNTTFKKQRPYIMAFGGKHKTRRKPNRYDISKTSF